MRELLLDVYDRLWRRYGPQYWWPGDTDFEIVIGAILTQSTNWRNAAKALDNLKQVGALEPVGLAALSEEELATLLRPSGYYRAKTRKVQAFVALLLNHYDGELSRLLALPAPTLRQVLLATHGIGPETADSIILYAARQPVFVVDAYTRRIFSRLGVCPPAGSYDELQALFMDNLDRSVDLFNEYHALLVRLGKEVCRKQAPRCGECALLALCPTGRQNVV